jgi:hypothetical protein
VLAFHIPSSDVPVALEGVYFVRQGSSTRYVHSAEMVRQMMAARGHNEGAHIEYTTLGDGLSSPTHATAGGTHATAGGTHTHSADSATAISATLPTASAVSPTMDDTETETTAETARPMDVASQTTANSFNLDAQQGDALSRLKEVRTSLIRSNVVNNWEENYGIDTVAYLRFFDGGEWCVMDEENWDEGWLTLAVHDREEKGSLLMVYEDGTVNRVPMDLCLEKVRNKHFKRYNERTPLFFCPVAAGDALLTAYLDDHGNRFFRLDDIDRIPEGKMLSAGNKLVRPEFKQFVFCEVIPAGQLGGLEKFHNLKDTTLGHSLDVHYEKERKILSNLGIKF